MFQTGKALQALQAKYAGAVPLAELYQVRHARQTRHFYFMHHPGARGAAHQG